MLSVLHESKIIEILKETKKFREIFLCRVKTVSYFSEQMDKKEQKKFTESVSDHLANGGIKLEWFYKNVPISRTHWHFLKKGERPLSEKKKEQIETLLQTKLIIS